MVPPPVAEKGSLGPCPHRDAQNCQLPTRDGAHRGPGWTPRKPPTLRPALFLGFSHWRLTALRPEQAAPGGPPRPLTHYARCQVSLQPLPSLPARPQPLLPPQPSSLGCQARSPPCPQWPEELRKLTHLTAHPRPSRHPLPGAESTWPVGRPPWRPCPRVRRPLSPAARPRSSLFTGSFVRWFS